MATNDVILGAGELFIMEFTGSALPDDITLEVAGNNVGHCSGGASINYAPKTYDVKNQYGRTVKSFVTEEEVSFKSGILSWDLARLQQLSTAVLATASGKKTLTFGGGGSLKSLVVRFVHTKADGKKLRFTMVGQNGAGFELNFEGGKELVIDAEIKAIEAIKGFLAKLEEEV